jgi:small subunit ribosomal protein S10
MLGHLKSSRHELLAAMEGKAPKELVKRITLSKDLKQTKSVMENVKRLAAMKERAVVRNLVDKYISKDNNQLTNLIQKSSEMRQVLDPMSAQRQILTIRFTAFDKRAYMAGLRLAKACKMMGLEHAGPVGLPQKIKRWTVLKSPFKYKKHQQTWEKRYIRSIVTIDTGDRADLVPNLIEFLRKTTYTACDVKIKTRRFIVADQIYVDPYVKERLSAKPATSGVAYGEFELDDSLLKASLETAAKVAEESKTASIAAKTTKVTAASQAKKDAKKTAHSAKKAKSTKLDEEGPKSQQVDSGNTL